MNEWACRCGMCRKAALVRVERLEETKTQCIKSDQAHTLSADSCSSCRLCSLIVAVMIFLLASHVLPSAAHS
jgi:hypothetical protein